MMVRMRQLEAYGLLYVLRRSRMPGFGIDGMKASAKSCAEEGEEGVTMMVGRGDFPATSVIERSKGAGRSNWLHCGNRCKRGPGRGISKLSIRGNSNAGRVEITRQCGLNRCRYCFVSRDVTITNSATARRRLKKFFK